MSFYHRLKTLASLWLEAKLLATPKKSIKVRTKMNLRAGLSKKKALRIKCLFRFSGEAKRLCRQSKALASTTKAFLSKLVFLETPEEKLRLGDLKLCSQIWFEIESITSERKRIRVR